MASSRPPASPASDVRQSFIERLSRTWLWWLIAIPLLIWSVKATNFDLPLLIGGAPKAREILTDLVQPSLVTRGEEIQEAYAQIQVPCTGEGPVQKSAGKGPELTLSQTCLNARESLTIRGTGFRPNTDGRIYWQPPDTPGRLRDERFTTDAEGNFTVETDIPPLLAEHAGITQVQALLTWTSGRLRPSPALRTTFGKIIETVFLALMATTFGGILAIPLSFLGARNLMPHTWLGDAVYGVTRTFFNFMRSIEPLILATIFAIWVGFGPFAGVLALAVSTIANIGKLYAEAVESIDPGPLEAIRATGANEIQTIVYGVIPQIIPPYLSFTIYYWDINVRMSTIIGFVGGGGIGLELSRWINQLQWNNAATAVWAIVLVVTLMDYSSAIARERLV
ncbi:MAG: phosphonate ABC transporter, permease protein PhnE [Ardenticatenaceae bacterium]|nr:phosphonate ABC transporter, permease protein PhnE [Ardenticatenaceae bacterium]HBY95219.1 phosphonate ABC transporter, permease protein PhnE [Chloroflexota bacterium]